MSAHLRKDPGKEGVAFSFFCLWMRCRSRAGAHFRRRVSGANTAGFGWEANEVRWAGIRIMSGANTDEPWSDKSLWSGMERSGMEDDNL
jgi:hypothetical protein